MKHYSQPRNIRFEDEAAKKIEALVESSGLKWSDVVRILVRKGLSAEERAEAVKQSQPELELAGK